MSTAIKEKTALVIKEYGHGDVHSERYLACHVMMVVSYFWFGLCSPCIWLLSSFMNRFAGLVHPGK